MNIAFDIDNTIYKVEYEKYNDQMLPIGQVPDYELMQVLFWYVKNGNIVFVWSAGGLHYAEQICRKLGIFGMVRIIRKDAQTARENNIDITYDDQEVNLGKVNIKINRRNDG